MLLGINHVITANHVISLMAGSTTDPWFLQRRFRGYTGLVGIN
jgi:hypothetical protein